MSSLSKPLAEVVSRSLAHTNLPLFVARLDADGQLVVGTFERSGLSTLRSGIMRAIGAAGAGLRVRVMAHDAARMARYRSLEALLGSTGTGELVFDRTKALLRAESVVELGSRVREKLGDWTDGLFFHAERRTLFVVLKQSLTSDSATQSRILTDVSEVRRVWSAGQDSEFDVSVRLGVDVPIGLDVIAVDRATVRMAIARVIRRPLKSKAGVALLGMLLGASVAVPALGADLVVTPPASNKASTAEPAVDEPNLSISALSGVARDPVLFSHLWAGLDAKGTIPLGERFGAQLDVGVATDQYYGAALHLFARDPSMGLVGIIGSAESKYGVTMDRVGAELEYYLSDKFTVGARVGLQGGTVPHGAYGDLKVKFYPDPNFAITAGGEVQPTFAVGTAGFEWRPAVDALAGMSVSADGSVTSTGDYRVTFGLHFQVGGKSNTLLDRDRRSDPDRGIYNPMDVSSAVPKSTGYVN